MDKEQCKDKYIYTHSENGSNLKRTSHVSHHPLRTFSFWGPPAITKLIMSPPKANPSFVHWITSLRPFRNIAPEMRLFPSCDRFFASIQQVPPANKPIAISPTLKTIASLDSTFTTICFLSLLTFVAKSLPRVSIPIIPPELALWGFLRSSTWQNQCSKTNKLATSPSQGLSNTQFNTLFLNLIFFPHSAPRAPARAKAVCFQFNRGGYFCSLFWGCVSLCVLPSGLLWCGLTSSSKSPPLSEWGRKSRQGDTRCCKFLLAKPQEAFLMLSQRFSLHLFRIYMTFSK